jgi:hypothetical protein
VVDAHIDRASTVKTRLHQQQESNITMMPQADVGIGHYSVIIMICISI